DRGSVEISVVFVHDEGNEPIQEFRFELVITESFLHVGQVQNFLTGFAVPIVGGNTVNFQNCNAFTCHKVDFVIQVHGVVQCLVNVDGLEPDKGKHDLQFTIEVVGSAVFTVHGQCTAINSERVIDRNLHGNVRQVEVTNLQRAFGGFSNVTIQTEQF